MFDSVLPAESEPISVVSSRWLWATRFFALIYATSLVGEYVAAAHFDLLNPLVLFTFGHRSLLSLVLLYFLFRSGKKSLAFALGLGAATAFILTGGAIIRTQFKFLIPDDGSVRTATKNQRCCGNTLPGTKGGNQIVEYRNHTITL